LIDTSTKTNTSIANYTTKLSSSLLFMRLRSTGTLPAVIHQTSNALLQLH